MIDARRRRLVSPEGLEELENRPSGRYRLLDAGQMAAAGDLNLRQSVAGPRGILRALLTVLVLMAFMLLGAGAALWVFRADVARTIIQWERVPPVPGGPIRRLAVPLPPIPPPADVDSSTSAGSR